MGVTAAVQTGPNRLEIREFPFPEIGPDDGLLRVERNGICGSDVTWFHGDPDPAHQYFEKPRSIYPVILGHEPLGLIEQIGERAAERWGVSQGDRVVVEATVPCGECQYCKQGLFKACPTHKELGRTPLDVAPSLWGGFSEYLYLAPHSLIHKISKDVPLDVAATFNALAGGVSWASEVPGTKPGDVVVILSPGQRGLACVIAAKAAGASKIIVSGLERDQYKLDAALELGATATVNVDKQDLVGTVNDILSGELVDVVVDIAPHATQTLLDAISMAKPGGTIVIAGLKGAAVEGFCTDDLARKQLTVRGVWGKPSRSFAKAVQVIESGQVDLSRFASRSFPLTEAASAIDTLAYDPSAICVSVAP